MTRPFQFSMGGLMAAVALFALSVWLFTVARDSPENAPAATAALPLALGSAVGSLLGRGGVGAIATVIAYCLLGWLLLQLEDEPLVNGHRRGVFERRRYSVVASPDESINPMNHPG